MACRSLLLLVGLFALTTIVDHVHALSSSHIFAIRQSATNKSVQFHLIQPDSAAVTTATDPALNFEFPFPLIEATGTGIGKPFYVVAYPIGAPNAVLLKLTPDLQLEQSWKQEKGQLSFFDLRFSQIQQRLYGIAVDSRYGRTLSQINTEGSAVTAVELQTLPYPYYVNASCFDHKTDTYWGLINCPLSNCSSQQKIIRGDFSNPSNSSSMVYDITPGNATIHYVVFASTDGGLYGTGYDHMTNVPVFGRITPSTSSNGMTFHVIAQLPFPLYAPVPPLVTIADSQRLCCLLPQSLWCWDIGTDAHVRLYLTGLPAGDYGFVAAVSNDVSTW